MYLERKTFLENFGNRDTEADKSKWNGSILGYLWKRSNFQIVILKKVVKIQKSKVALNFVYLLRKDAV